MARPSYENAPLRALYAASRLAGVAPEQLISPRRDAFLVSLRQAAFAAAREAGATLGAIGRRFRRDHTTVLHGIRVHRERAARDASAAALGEALALAMRAPLDDTPPPALLRALSGVTGEEE